MVDKNQVISLVLCFSIGVVVGLAVLIPQQNNLIDKINSLIEQVETIPLLLNQISALENVTETQSLVIENQNLVIENYESLLDSELEYIHNIQKLLESQKYEKALLEKLLKTINPLYQLNVNFDLVYGDKKFEDWWDENKANILFKR